MTALDLKPCPFCGGDARVYGTSWTTRDGEYQCWVTCRKCGTFGPSSTDAIAAWNTRAPAEALAVPDSFDTLISEARAEAQKAMRKFPQPNYVISKIAEEAGEVVKAAIHAAEGRETLENLRGEMKQTIAMLFRLWVEGDQVHGLQPIDPDRAIGERAE